MALNASLERADGDYTIIEIMDNGAGIAGLVRVGINVLTAIEDGATRTPDPELLDRAGELMRALVTQDKGFMSEAAQRLRSNQSFAGIIYAPQGIPYARFIADLELIAKASDFQEFRNRVTFVPLS